MAKLKETLNSFAANTGLTLNFDKCTFVPVNVAQELAAQLVAMFGFP